MNKPILQMNRGLQASGKTTASMELVVKGWKRVNKDDLRSMIDGGKWSKKNEEYILKIEKFIAAHFLTEGYNVVVDDTNFAHFATWQQIAISADAEFVVKDFDTPVQECVRRNLLRGEPVPTDAIWKMYRQHVQPNIKKPAYDVSLPDCILVDIDGTLAHMKDRSPFEWDRVGEDSMDENVAHIVDAMKEAGREVIIVSGRDACCQMDTEKWLDDNNVPYDEIYMRPVGDKRPDHDVKREIYENNIKGKRNVIVVLDDRDSVVALWRELGLTCAQMGYGCF